MQNEKPTNSSQFGLLVVISVMLSGALLVLGYILGRLHIPAVQRSALLENPTPQANTLPLHQIASPRSKLVSILRSRWMGVFTGLLSVVSFGLAGWKFRWETYQIWTTPFEALNWTLLGAVLVAISVYCLRPHFTEFTISRNPARTYQINWVIVGFSSLALFVVGMVNGVHLSEDTPMQQNMQLDQNLQFLLLVAGCIGLIVGFGGFVSFKMKSLVDVESDKAARIDLVLVGVAELCLLGLVQIIFGIALTPALNAIVIIAILVSMLYGSGVMRKRSKENFFYFDFPALRKPHFTLHMLALILIVAIGFFVRVWQLDTGVHITVDEMHFWNGLMDLRSSSTMPILLPIDYIASFTHIFPYLQKLSVDLLGPDLFAMRFPSAITGTLTILAVYFLVREGLDKNTALLAAALLAVFPPAMHFSRTALNNIGDPLFGTLALAFLIRAMKHNSQRDYVLAGICFGWTAYFYEGGRLLFLGLFPAYLIYLIVTQRPWAHLRNWLLMGICAILVFGPYYYAMSSAGYSFSMRLVDRGGPELQKYNDTYQKTHSLAAAFQQYYDDSLKYPFYHILYSPDGSKFYYGGETALLQWFLVPFFLLGVFLALFVFRRFGWLLLLWVLLTGFGTSLVSGSDWTARLVAYFIPIVVLVAIGLRYPFEMLIDALNPRSISVPQVNYSALLPKLKLVLYALITVFIVVAGAYQIKYYFTTHLQLYNREVRPYRYDFLDAFYRSIGADPNSHLVYVVQVEPNHDSLSEEELNTWIKFKQVPLSFEVVDITKFTAEKIAELANWRKDHTLVFAIEPPVVFTDAYEVPLNPPQTIAINQQAHNLIVSTFPDAQVQVKSQYTTVPLFQQYQVLIVPPLPDSTKSFKPGP